MKWSLHTGSDDLPLVRQVFRADEADDAVDQKRLEFGGPRRKARAFERELVDAVMSIGGEGAPPGRFSKYIRLSPTQATSRFR